MRSIRVLGTALAAALLAAAFAWTGAASAQSEQRKSCAQQRSELASSTHLSAVNRLFQNKCLGGSFDPDPFTRRVEAVFAKAARAAGQARAPQIRTVVLSADERRTLAVEVLRIADEYLNEVAANAGSADLVNVKSTQGSVRKALLDLEKGEAVGGASRELHKTFWEWEMLDRGLDMPLPGAGIEAGAMFKRAGCDAAPGGASCVSTRTTVEGLLRGAMFAQRSFSPEQAAMIQKEAKRAAERAARWESYFADARSQYPWELFVNSWRYKREVRGDQGLSGPPNWQWIVLHPDIGMQYVRDAERGDRFKPAMILELIGYNRWSWGSDNRATNAWGASLVRTYADTASVPTSAWGVAIHRNNKYTLTLTRREGKTGVLLSVDLVGKVTAASQEWKDRFESLSENLGAPDR